MQPRGTRHVRRGETRRRRESAGDRGERVECAAAGVLLKLRAIRDLAITGRADGAAFSEAAEEGLGNGARWGWGESSWWDVEEVV